MEAHWITGLTRSGIALMRSVAGVISMNTSHKGVNLGERNGQWKGSKVGYTGIHSFIYRHKIKPLKCERCGRVTKLDLANISDLYKRDLSDWWWLCRKCHMTTDGRLDNLVKNNPYKKHPDNVCDYCHRSFHPWRTLARYCSHSCAALFRYRISHEKSWVHPSGFCNKDRKEKDV